MDQAKDLGKKIIKARVAACVNVWPIESVYFSDGECKEDHEAVLLVKTLEPKVAEIEEFLEKNHSYKVPIVAVVNVHRLNRGYKDWMTQIVV